MKGLVNPLPSAAAGRANPQGLAANGQAPMSWWESGSTAPARSESRAASPQGLSPKSRPAASRASQMSGRRSGCTKISKPNSPV